MSVSQFLQRREVAVIVSVGVVVTGVADHLQSIDNDEHGVQVFAKELLHLFHQSVAQNSALGTEVDVGW